MKDKLLTSFLLAAMLVALTSTAIASTTWYVNGVSGSNSNACTSPTTACKTVGHAISLAASGDSIRVAAATYTENLTISISLKILGSAASTTIIDGGGVGTVVTVSSAAANVSLSRVTIRNGRALSGGGIRNLGTLTLNNSIIANNRALIGGGITNGGGTAIISNSTVQFNHASVPCSSVCLTLARGGGILNGASGVLRISKSTISQNTAYTPIPPTGPFGSYGGGIDNAGTAIISNSTISANSARVGAYYLGAGGGFNNGGTVIINNGTLGNNTGGGVRNSTGSATIQNSIIAYNSRGNCFGTMTSNGYNLSSDDTCNFTSTGDLNNTDPMLGLLQYNGGPTQTMALPSGSPAVDTGNPNGCTDGLGHLLKTDQRGKPRPDTEDTGGCDMGAYERQSD
jgi:hypothetical protein